MKASFVFTILLVETCSALSVPGNHTLGSTTFNLDEGNKNVWLSAAGSHFDKV